MLDVPAVTTHEVQTFDLEPMSMVTAVSEKAPTSTREPNYVSFCASSRGKATANSSPSPAGPHQANGREGNAFNNNAYAPLTRRDVSLQPPFLPGWVRRVRSR